MALSFYLPLFAMRSIAFFMLCAFHAIRRAQRDGRAQLYYPELDRVPSDSQQIMAHVIESAQGLSKDLLLANVVERSDV